MSKQDFADAWDGAKNLMDALWTLWVGAGAIVVLANTILDSFQHAQWDIKRVVLIAAVVPVGIVFANLAGNKLREMGKANAKAGYKVKGR